MRKSFRLPAFLVMVTLALGLGGCASLSLFSSPEKHTHYHGGAELKERVDCLEKKVEHLESGQTIVSHSESGTIKKF
ncbi:MAG: hypothetical protein ACLFUS_10785 [Candidatus Sumerlaeia bacterium]